MSVENELRDARGRWTAGGATAVADPRALEVGGDEWNKQTAARLESEYAKVRPDLDKLAHDIIAKGNAIAPPSPLDSAKDKIGKATLEELTGGGPKSLNDLETAALIGEYGSVNKAYNVVSNDPDEDEDEEPEEDEIPLVPEEWDQLSADDQQTVEDHYYESNLSDFLDDEKNNWSENDGPAEAAQMAAEDDDWKAEWLTDYIADRAKEGEPPLPYTAQQLNDAIKLNFDRDSAMGYSLSSMQKNDEKETEPEKKYLDIEFDDEKLQEPTHGGVSKDQMTLPGIEPKDPSSALTPEMRDDIESNLRDAFWEHADKKTNDLEYPEYLEESAKDNMKSYWDEMDDDQKFKYADKNTDVISNYEPKVNPETGKKEAVSSLVPTRMPEKFDPMNETSGQDYKDTQKLATAMADTRAEQIMAQRGIKSEGSSEENLMRRAATIKNLEERIAFIESNRGVLHPPVSLDDIKRVDERLWSGWKGSSTGNEGRILQVAAADELGGRLRGQLKPPEPPAPGPKKKTMDQIAQDMGYGGWHNLSPVQQQKVSDAFDKQISSNTPSWTPPPKGEMQTLFSGAQANLEVFPAGKTLKTHDGFEIQKQEDGSWKAVAFTPISPSLDRPENQTLRGEIVTAPTNRMAPATGRIVGDHEEFTRLPDINVLRNGAASMTTDPKVANGWGGTPVKADEISRDDVIRQANEIFANIGGYEGVKAAVRAKWETTQYLLDRADMPVVQAYRGIGMPHLVEGTPAKTGEFNPPSSGKVNLSEDKQADLGYAKVGTSYKIFSGKTITKISENDPEHAGSSYPKGAGTWQWQEPPDPARRVVLRAEVPRTAVLSVPAYGQNLHSEHEIVVTGTGWKGWDAWSGTAPTHEQVPMGTPPVSKKEAARVAGRDSVFSEYLAKEGSGTDAKSWPDWLKEHHPEYAFND